MEKDLPEVDGINTMGEDSLSAEEKEKIYSEMEEILAQSALQNKDTKRFDISSLSSGTKPLFLFNILLVLIVAGSITAAATIINTRSSREEMQTLVINDSVESLAAQLITKNKEDLNEKNKELEEIQSQLQAALDAQGDLEAQYNLNISTKENEIKQDIDSQLAQLRAQLQSENVSEAEIKSQLATLEKRLRREYEIELAKYKEQQEQELLEKEKEFDSQINNLQRQYASNEAVIENLRNEINQKEDELNRRNAEINSQLSDTQQQLVQLRQDNEARKKAFEQFNIYHHNIANQIKEEKFLEAKSAIAIAERNLLASGYEDDQDAQTYKDAYNTYRVMIDTALAAQSLIDSSSGDAQKLLQEKKELEDKNEELETTIEEQEKATQEQQAELEKAFEKQQQELEKQFRSLQQKYASLETTAARAKKDARNDVLFDMKLIIQYLNTKYKTGSSDKELISGVNQKDYNDIIRLMINAIDPSGNLTY